MVVDFHSHILPGIDDGSPDVETSLEMLRAAAEQGIRHVVATPHFYARYDSPERFLAKRDRAEAQLRRALEQHPELPEISVGAEVYYFRGISESDHLPQLTIRGKRCILIEMPHAPWPEDILREVSAIWEKRGIIPVIAHVDRYIAPLRTHGIPRRLEEMPVYVQANADFFLERSTAAMAMRMLKSGRIHLLGSDCHDMDRRPPNLAQAVERIRRKLGEDAISSIQEFQRRVLDL